jgi:hypothetical protein
VRATTTKKPKSKRSFWLRNPSRYCSIINHPHPFTLWTASAAHNRQYMYLLHSRRAYACLSLRSLPQQPNRKLRHPVVQTDKLLITQVNFTGLEAQAPQVTVLTVVTTTVHLYRSMLATSRLSSLKYRYLQTPVRGYNYQPHRGGSQTPVTVVKQQPAGQENAAPSMIPALHVRHSGHTPLHSSSSSFWANAQSPLNPILMALPLECKQSVSISLRAQ